MADPLFANVTLLLHCDGADGATTITDSGPLGLASTLNGPAQLVVSEKKFGLSSFLPGLGGEASFGTALPGFRTGDFTIELWAYFITASYAAERGLFQLDTGGGYASAGYASTLAVFCGPASNWTIYGAGGVHQSATTITTGVWHHVALEKYDGLLKLYVDGAEVLSVADSFDYDLGGGGVIGSYYASSYSLDGFIDEFRITRNVARYQGPFTPPTTAFGEEGGTTTYVLSGNVKDAAGANVARDVAIFRRSPLTHLTTVTSDGSTGNYSYTTAFNEPHVLVALPATGEALNALVLDRVTPKAVTT